MDTGCKMDAGMLPNFSHDSEKITVVWIVKVEQGKWCLKHSRDQGVTDDSKDAVGIDGVNGKEDIGKRQGDAGIIQCQVLHCFEEPGLDRAISKVGGENAGAEIDADGWLDSRWEGKETPNGRELRFVSWTGSCPVDMIHRCLSLGFFTSSRRVPNARSFQQSRVNIGSVPFKVSGKVQWNERVKMAVVVLCGQ
jgi:hypothetical protein